MRRPGLALPCALALGCTAVFGGAPSAAARPGPSSVEPTAAQSRMLEEVNAARARYGADPLVWDAALYPGAQRFAQECRFDNSNGADAFADNKHVAPGETGFTEALAAWMKEAALYDFDRPGFSPATAHFSQTVWKGSTSVAVGIARCTAGDVLPEETTLVVARFAPPGNRPGEFSRNVGSPR